VKLINSKLIVLIAGAGILFISYFLISYPMIKSMHAVKLEISAKNKELKEKVRFQNDLKSLREERAILQDEMRQFKQTLPRQEGVKNFLKEVWEIAGVNGIVIESLEPGNVTRGSQYSWIPLKLVLKGDFKEVYAFISRIESIARLIRVGKMRIAILNSGPGAPETASLNRSIPLRADLELRAYISGETGTGSGQGNTGGLTEFIDPPVDEPAEIDELNLLRDPFQSPGLVSSQEEEENISQAKVTFSLQGVMFNGSIPSALIDGEVYTVGEKVGDALIKDITEKGVIIIQNEQEIPMTISEGGE
jgi:Tfp pilus assembly protein PilO